MAVTITDAGIAIPRIKTSRLRTSNAQRKEFLALRVELAFDPDQPRDNDGRWTDSGFRALQGKVKRDEGFTVHPRTGVVPKTGYQVGLGGKTMKPIPTVDEFLHGDEEVLAERFDNWLAENAEAFDDPEVHIGGWADRDTGLVHLDPSKHVESLAEALDLGSPERENQIEIWDNVNKVGIPTGGRGDG